MSGQSESESDGDESSDTTTVVTSPSLSLVREFNAKLNRLADTSSEMRLGTDYDLELDSDPTKVEDSESVKAWLDWCYSHSHTRCVESDVPVGILPKNYSGVLIDVKVGVKGKSARVPDDKIYLAHEDLRQKVARGNCVLKLEKIEKGRTSDTKYIFLVFALKKFSGGLGDEDDSNSDRSDWMNYFRDSIHKARKMVATEKANGEAAHISSWKLFGKNYFCIGSKNVHMLIRSMDDISKYKEDRYEFARRISRAFFNNYLDNTEISSKKKEAFCSFIQKNQYTSVLEIIQRENQHVVNLNYLEPNRPELKFICWTKPDLEDDLCGENTLCPLPIDEALDMARGFGLNTIGYETIHFEGDVMTRTENYMDKIRADYGNEGKVLYFLDSQNRTLGLIKKKTVWYIILRAIREKVALISNKRSISLSELNTRLEDRLKKLKNWLGYTDHYHREWVKVATEFARWIYRKQPTEIRSKFPVILEQFLSENIEMKEKYETLIKSFELKL